MADQQNRMMHILNGNGQPKGLVELTLKVTATEEKERKRPAKTEMRRYTSREDERSCCRSSGMHQLLRHRS